MTSYRSFSLESIETEFGIKNKRVRLFQEIEAVTVSDWLQNFLNMSEELPIKSEKARSELIVMPILIALRNHNDKFFTIYSGDYLNVDEAKGLRGECDFILAKDTGSFNINVPILQVVEAKRNDVEIGIPQCAAQMIGAKLYNEQRGLELSCIYGCVTTGDNWQFMKLSNNELLIDSRKYYLGNVSQILGVFQEIIDFYKKELESKIFS